MKDFLKINNLKVWIILDLYITLEHFEFKIPTFILLTRAKITQIWSQNVGMCLSSKSLSTFIYVSDEPCETHDCTHLDHTNDNDLERTFWKFLERSCLQNSLGTMMKLMHDC